MMSGNGITVTISIKTDGMPPATLTGYVEKFRDVERLGKKLAGFVKSAGKVLPDLKDATVENITVTADDEGGGKKRRKKSAADSPRKGEEA